MATKLPIDTRLADIMEQRFIPVAMRGKRPHTIARYRAAVKRFDEYLMRPATLADLTDEIVSAFLMAYAERNSVTSPRTVNNLMINLRRFWTWCAKKRFAEEFPELSRLPEPEIIPTAWSENELRRLFESCEEEDKQVGRIPGWMYWRTVCLFVMDTGERSGAIRQIQWEHYDAQTGYVTVPAIIRKGGEKGAVYQLRPATMDGLRKMRELDPHAVLMFGNFKFDVQTWYNRFAAILKRAGLPHGRRDKLHKLRRTFATYIELCGGDATEALLHCERRTTVKSYLDSSMLAKQKKYQHAPLPAGVVAEAEGMEFREMIPVDPEDVFVPKTPIRVERGAIQ